MKKIALTLALLLPLAAAAQTETGGGARMAVGAEYKITKGLHVSLQEELRMSGAFQSLDRLYTTVGLDYKPAKYVKLGVGYVLINPYDAIERSFKPARHRFYFDAGAHFTANYFSFSVRERLQLTHRTGSVNVYQTNPNALVLKTRFGVEYKGWTYFEPGVFFEMRTALNEPMGEISGEMKTKADGTTYYDYTPGGYTHVYNNRYRFIFRTDIKLSKHHVLRPYAFFDICKPYVIDTNAEGTRLFSAAYQKRFDVIIGINYTFKF